ncbi:RICIN domain-containing protein [Gynuella sunshinyii]|uniref:pectin lyase n=1 Tax=Gynuella sunshinyii YC6258 TaxID=1445510 RepID=A0A0C5VQ50_9GAMM|nr:RICIN domain-containing protein [Gynuella sunshinyii]AJQ95563.1 pectate lyase [Gynuella sunshinyii YC6258]
MEKSTSPGRWITSIGVRNAIAAIGVLVSSVVQAGNCIDMPVSGHTYTIINEGSGLALDVSGKSRNDGAGIIQWPDKNAPNQQWKLVDIGSGNWSIRAVHSDKSLDVYQWSKLDGAPIKQWSFGWGQNQKWKLNSTSNGAFKISSAYSKLLMTVKNADKGSTVYQNSDISTAFQNWYLNPVDGNCTRSTDVQAQLQPDGFASQTGPDGLVTTTGGGDVAPTVVRSCDALIQALSDDAARVVHIPDNTTIDCRTPDIVKQVCATQCPAYLDPNKFTYRFPVGNQTCLDLGSTTNQTVSKAVNSQRVLVKSHKTVLGLGSGSKVKGLSFVLPYSKNVILKNFAIEDVNPGLIEAGGGVYLDHASHVWLDHLSFSRISDGYVDMSSAKNVTLSWSHFDGHAPEISCDNQHPFVMFADNSTVTYHHNFYDTVGGRNPKLSGSGTRAHLYNNYWHKVTYYSTYASHGAQAKIEGNYYDDASRPHWNEPNASVRGYLDVDMDSNRYTGISTITDGRDSGDYVFGDVTLYPYTLDNVDQLPTRLLNQTGPQ